MSGALDFFRRDEGVDFAHAPHPHRVEVIRVRSAQDQRWACQLLDRRPQIRIRAGFGLFDTALADAELVVAPDHLAVDLLHGIRDARDDRLLRHVGTDRAPEGPGGIVIVEGQRGGAQFVEDAADPGAVAIGSLRTAVLQDQRGEAISMIERVGQRVDAPHGMAENVRLLDTKMVDQRAEIVGIVGGEIVLLGIPFRFSAPALIQREHVKAIREHFGKAGKGPSVAAQPVQADQQRRGGGSPRQVMKPQSVQLNEVRAFPIHDFQIFPFVRPCLACFSWL